MSDPCEIIFYEHEYLGSHTGILKTLEDTVKQSIKNGYYNIQIFLGSSYSLKRRNISHDDIEKTNKLLKYNNINIFTHIPYVYNLAGSVKENCFCWNQTKIGENNDVIRGQVPVEQKVDNYVLECLKSIEYELEIIDKLDCKVKGCVIHIGSSGKLSSIEGLKRVAESINKINFNNIKSCKLLLETMVGRGGVLGRTFDELKQVYDLIENKDRIGFCIDTCHVFSEGLYDLRKKDEIDKMFNDFDKVFGINKLELIHLNDSKTQFNSKQDRHERIGRGEIFKNIKSLQYLLKKINDYKISSVLETVEEDYDIIQQSWNNVCSSIK